MERFIWSMVLMNITMVLILSIYGIVRKPNLVKKLIALTILGDTANMFVIFIGYRLIYPVIPPVLPIIDQNRLIEFLEQAVDPLPQALVLTAVVIGLAVNCLIAFAIIQMYRLYGTVDVRKIFEKVFPEERV
uniref:Na+/H+ antiporter subunit C n=1 Tax=Staphylothermus marinus TaxID=2280 RepID=A0A7C4DA80_STAMA